MGERFFTCSKKNVSINIHATHIQFINEHISIIWIHIQFLLISIIFSFHIENWLGDTYD